MGTRSAGGCLERLDRSGYPGPDCREITRVELRWYHCVLGGSIGEIGMRHLHVKTPEDPPNVQRQLRPLPPHNVNLLAAVDPGSDLER